MIRVVIVEDEPLARQHLAELLTELPGVDVVACAENGRLGLAVIVEQKPDAVFLDIEMPGMKGIELMHMLPDRRHRAFAWGLLVLFTNLVGVAVYLIARKEWMECPSYGQGIERRFTFCPSCGHALKATCTNCGQPLQQDWVYCADCGTSRESGDKTE